MLAPTRSLSLLLTASLLTGCAVGPRYKAPEIPLSAQFLGHEGVERREDGVEQRVAYFASTEKPFTVALLIDTSGSTRFRLTEIQDSAIAFVEQLRPDDRVMVVCFSDKVKHLTKGATNDRALLRDAIRRTEPGDGTRLYDAVNDFVKSSWSPVP